MRKTEWSCGNLFGVEEVGVDLDLDLDLDVDFFRSSNTRF